MTASRASKKPPELGHDPRTDEGLLPWLSNDIDKLCAAVAQAKLPHALLFHGVQGVGKRSLAMHLAMGLLCQSPLAGRRCDNCKSCMLASAGMHPDLSVVAQEGDAAIGIDLIRLLQHVVAQTAQQGGNKVCVIEPAESMTESAANALLKILEEPPSDTYFLLLAHRPTRLPRTIHSRCVQQAVSRPAREQLRAWLAEQFPDADIDSALDAGRGIPWRCRRLLHDGEEHWATEKSVLRLLEGRYPPTAMLAAIKPENYRAFVEQFVAVIHAAASSKAIGEALPGRSLADFCTLQQLASLQATALALLARADGMNIEKLQLQLEAFLVDCVRIVQNPHSELRYPALS